MRMILRLFLFMLIAFINLSSEVDINAGILIANGFDDISFSITYNLLSRAGIKIDVIKVSK